MTEIDTIIFDLGGVLIDYDRMAAVRAFERIGFPQAAELLDPYLQSGIFLRLEAGEATPQELHEYIQKTAGQQATPERIDAALNSFLIDLPGYKLEMLLDLRRRGFRVCMLSNTNPIMFSHAVRTWFEHDGHTLGDYFDECFLSFELKAVKPGPEIFRRMIERGGIAPSRALFIDDGKANTQQAARMGFHTYTAAEGEDFRHIFKGMTVWR